MSFVIRPRMRHALIGGRLRHMRSVITRDPNILGGTPVFSGTRVPVRILFEHLEAGDRLDDFIEGYPSVKREQAVALIELVIQQLPKLDDEAAA
jgi:uncharacterized protein (DUF433 family)